MAEPTWKLAPGDEMANGAIVLKQIENKVLCLWWNNPQPFVVWTYNEEDKSTYWGHYFNTIDEALTYFNQVIAELGLK